MLKEVKYCKLLLFHVLSALMPGMGDLRVLRQPWLILLHLLSTQRTVGGKPMRAPENRPTPVELYSLGSAGFFCVWGYGIICGWMTGRGQWIIFKNIALRRKSDPVR